MKKTLPALTAICAASVLLLGGCVSASRLLERAESMWAAGQYAQSIESALQSYEKAVDRNKEPDEIAAAKAFLEDRFPLANEYLLDQAQRQLEGPDSEKAEAWKTFETLVNMNRRVRDSIAGSFLGTENFEDQLQRAKEVAAQIQYVKGLELMGQGSREAYMEAYYIFRQVDSFVPDYRDVRLLADECRAGAMLTVALSNVNLNVNSSGDATAPAGVSGAVMDSVRSFISSNDNPDFLTFITAGSAAGASDAGAVLYIEIKGSINVESDVDDGLYVNLGQASWERSYSGSPSLVVTRIADLRTEIATANIDFEQKITVSFHPVRQGDLQLSESDYNGKFNNASWVSSQLNTVKSGMSRNGSEGYMVVWGELQYGGAFKLQPTADVYTGEGYVQMPVDPALWNSTAQFIGTGLPGFLAFSDLNLSKRLANELSGSFLSNGAVKDLLTNLEG